MEKNQQPSYIVQGKYYSQAYNEDVKRVHGGSQGSNVTLEHDTVDYLTLSISVMYDVLSVSK